MESPQNPNEFEQTVMTHEMAVVIALSETKMHMVRGIN